MNIFKSHFWYHKNQRNGIFILGLIIIVFQLFIFYFKACTIEIEEFESQRTQSFYKQIDSLKALEKKAATDKQFPFNPNYITDYKGAKLGMSLEEIDRLLVYRSVGKFINSKEEFQKLTMVSDSLLSAISPFFKFPDWVVQQHKKKRASSTSNFSSLIFIAYNKTTLDINKATIADFRSIYGIGEKLSERIIKYRSKLQGFSMGSQLYDVWGLNREVADKVLAVFKITALPIIQKRNVNTVSFKELLKNPYIDYELCKKIFEYRDSVAELQDITELKNIHNFPLDLYDRIVLYLQAK
jgi:DNA uptake protein ComE-like DNA-binding protein